MLRDKKAVLNAVEGGKGNVRVKEALTKCGLKPHFVSARFHSSCSNTPRIASCSF